MNYMKIYNDLVNSARSIQNKNNGYVEFHHIIMKSLGGSNNKENLVEFTARQHYIAHLLLYKHYKSEMLLGKDKTPYYKALYALSAMVQFPASKDENGLAKRCFKFGSKLYQSWKEDLGVAASIRSKHQFEELKKDPIKYHNRITKIKTALKTNICMNGFWWSGRKHSNKTKQKIIDSRYDGHGSNNSMFNMVWISNETLCLTINVPINMLYDYIAEGWIKKRIINWKRYFDIKRLKEENLLNKVGRTKEDSILLKQNKFDEFLQKRQENKRKRQLKRESDIKAYSEMYEFYSQFGWELTKEKFNYQYSYPNFCQRCKALLKEFVPQNGKKRGS